jgi:multidrug resistance protein MdtO
MRGRHVSIAEFAEITGNCRTTGRHFCYFVTTERQNQGAGARFSRTHMLSLLNFRGRFEKDLRKAIDTSYVLREKINAELEQARLRADGVLFEFGPSRDADLTFRDLVRRWQPQFDALFLMRIAFLKYRLQAPGFETPESVLLFQAAYDADSADLLKRMANRVEDVGHEFKSGLDASPDSLKRTLDATRVEARRTLPAGRAESFITLLDGIDRLTASLFAEVATQFTT